MKRLIIVDDESLARQRLQHLLANHPEWEICGEASDGLNAVKLSCEIKPDLVLLDIEMPELNGLEVAAALPPQTKVIFCTAYDAFAIRAFELNAIDYLLKPITPARLAAALAKVPNSPALEKTEFLKEIQPKLNRLALRSGQRILVVNLGEVVAITAAGNYCEVVTAQRRILCDETLESLEHKINPAQFIRIHRSSLINISSLQELRREGDRKYLAILSNGDEFPVSRQKITALMDRIGGKT